MHFQVQGLGYVLQIENGIIDDLDFLSFLRSFYDNGSIMNIQLICFYHLFVLKTLYYNVLKIYPKLTTSYQS